MALTPEQYISAAHHLMVAKMFSIASLVMVLYDICLTVDEEVERIWKRRFSALTVLWCVNRYLAPLTYVIVTASWHMDWPTEVCRRYVTFPSYSSMISTIAVGSVFILRCYAVFACDKRVLAGGIVLLAITVFMKFWAAIDGARLVLPPGLVGCVLHGRTPGYRHPMIWVAELIFDSIMFFATLSRVITLHRRSGGMASSLLTLIKRDGILYFAVIFSVNLWTVIWYFNAPANDLKVINAAFSKLLTSLMVSRLILNIRGAMTDVEYGATGLGQISNGPISPVVLHQRSYLAFADDDIRNDDVPMSPRSPGARSSRQNVGKGALHTNQPNAW